MQGGSISPLLANIYLHYVLDLWAHQWREKQAQGDVIIVRFCDDFVLGFQHRHEAERFLRDMKQRMSRFGLRLHSDKTRLVEFGRYAVSNREKRGLGKPSTFNFLGFNHQCGRTRKGWFTIRRKTIGKKMQQKIREVKAELRNRMHDPVPEQGAYLRSVVLGHTRYFGVPTNSRSINNFRREVCRLWFRTLRRRSHKHRLTWNRMERLIAKWIPSAIVCHPYPSKRLCVTT